jgi:hypothetical protein
MTLGSEQVLYLVAAGDQGSCHLVLSRKKRVDCPTGRPQEQLRLVDAGRRSCCPPIFLAVLSTDDLVPHNSRP